MFVLFITQCLHRMHPCSPARREPASEQRDGQKQRGDNSERERVSGLNLVEESSHETRQGKRCGDSGTRADEREFEALSNHEGEDVAHLRPKRHARGCVTVSAITWFIVRMTGVGRLALTALTSLRTTAANAAGSPVVRITITGS